MSTPFNSSTHHPSSADSSAHPDFTVRDVAEYSDHRRPLVRALKAGGWALVAVTIISLMYWGQAREQPGILGVLLGVAIGGGFVLATAATVLATARSSPTTTMAVVLGGWLVKLAIVIVLLLWLRGFEFYDNAAFGVTTIVALVVALGAETWGIITSRTAYIS